MINTLVSVLLFFLFLGFTIPVQAAVVINEIVPKTEPSTGEWVELYNNGSESVSLNQWKLDHTAGNAKSFILNASMNIAPHGFLTLTGSQTAISFSIEGDTVRLFDIHGTLVDSQWYPGTLGYNTSMGRTSDGGGSWALCTTATFNTNNNCPQPSPTATPIPTNTPMPTPKPSTAPAPLLVTGGTTPAPQTFGSLLPSPTGQALGATDSISPTPTPAGDVLQLVISKPLLAFFLLGIAAAALSAMLVLWLKKR